MSNSVDIKVATKWAGIFMVFVTGSGLSGLGGSYLQNKYLAPGGIAETMRIDQAVMASQMIRLTDVVEIGFQGMAEDNKDAQKAQSNTRTEVATIRTELDDLKRRMSLVENHIYKP